MIHSVAVLGAGAVGSYVIWGISSLDDVELGVIAEGERAERIKNEGCLINDKVYHTGVDTKRSKESRLISGCTQIQCAFTCPAFYQRGSRRKHGCYEFNEWCRQ